MSDFDAVDPEVLGLGLGELLRRAVERWPDRVAAAFPGTRLSYRELWQGALLAGERLVNAGIRPGEHVGLVIPNSADFLTTLLGASLAGAVPVPLNTRYRSDELPYVVQHADLVALVTICDVAVNAKGEKVDYPSRLAEALPSLGAGGSGGPLCAEAPHLRLVAGYGPPQHAWVTPWPAPTATPGPRPAEAPGTPGWVVPSQPDGVALMLYTSGTTSRPKGVQVCHRALVDTGVLGMVGRMRMTIEDVVWAPMPMSHIGSFVALVGCFATGATLVSAPYFEAAAAVDLLTEEEVTIAYAGFPAFYLDIMARLAQTGGTLPHLRILTTAAAPAEVVRVQAGFPQTLQVSVTGSTELSGMICTNDLSDTPRQRAETAGRPIDGIELSIRDEHGREVEPGASGELWVRGYCLLKAYYKDPAPLLTGGPDPGWFRTGDLGAMVDGRFSFRGRLKDMVKVGGENVAAAEVENYLLEHPAVVVAQVVGMPDARLGEVPVAFLELATGHRLTEQEVRDYCRAGMAAYKVPRSVRFVTEWPMSATKIAKHVLRQAVAGAQAVPDARTSTARPAAGPSGEPSGTTAAAESS